MDRDDIVDAVLTAIGVIGGGFLVWGWTHGKHPDIAMILAVYAAGVFVGSHMFGE